MCPSQSPCPLRTDQKAGASQSESCLTKFSLAVCARAAPLAGLWQADLTSAPWLPASRWPEPVQPSHGCSISLGLSLAVTSTMLRGQGNWAQAASAAVAVDLERSAAALQRPSAALER